MVKESLIHSGAREEEEEKPFSLASLNPTVKYIFGLLLLPLLLVACGSREDVYRQESFVFGTRVEISIAGEDTAKAEAAAKAVLQRFDALHRKLHAWQPSELGRLNAAFAAGKKTAVAPELGHLLAEAKAYSLQGDELFNPAIGNLIRLWGFQADLPQSTVPAPAAIAAALQAAPSMRAVHVENGLAWSDNPAVRLDLGGYAKGYALDQAAVLLESRGIRNALINIGGNVLALGRHGERPWKIGIQHPRKPGVIASLELQDGEAIGTSGDYQRYFEAGGKRYCHLLDPRTGQPADGMQSVSVLVSGQHAGTRSDVLSKPLFIGGPGALEKMAQQIQVSQLLAIAADGRVLVSPELEKRLSWDTPKPAFSLLKTVR